MVQRARSKEWVKVTANKFMVKFHASSTWLSKQSKRRKIAQLLEVCGVQGPPVSEEHLTQVAALLDQTGMQSADQYVAELKLWHIETGHSWSEALERRLVLRKKALKRDIGPEKRAVEVKLEELDDLVWDLESEKTSEPKRIAWSYAWAVHWMLRAAEAAIVKAKHVALDWKKREVKLFIPKSKTDQQAQGAWRTLQCCRSATCSARGIWQ